MQVAGVPPSSSRMYEQALAHLHQHQYELAFVTAKQALDAAAGQSVRTFSSTRADHAPHASAGFGHIEQGLQSAQCCEVLAAAAAGMGDAEMAYCLYAQGYVSASQTAVFYDKLHKHESRRKQQYHDHQYQCQQQQQPPPQQQQHIEGELHDLIKQLAAGKLSMVSALSEVPDKQQQRWQHHPGSKRWRQLQRRFDLPKSTTSSSSSSSSNSSRVFCVSDLHVDAPGGHNLAWVERISTTKFKNDVLIIAGDVGDTVAAVQTAFKLLSPKFSRVIWVPGNHEAWIRPGSRDEQMYPDSICKIIAMRQIAEDCGVDIGPVQVSSDVMIVPLMSWYNCQFDIMDQRPGRYRHDSFCHWPVPDDAVWGVMLGLNTQTIELVRQRLRESRPAAAAIASMHSPSQSKNLYEGSNLVWRQQQQQQQQQQHKQASSAHSCPAQTSSSSSSSCDCGGSAATIANCNNYCCNSRPRVTWNHEGVLSVKSARKVPGLQINLQPRTRQCQQQQQQPSAEPSLDVQQHTAGPGDCSTAPSKQQHQFHQHQVDSVQTADQQVQQQLQPTTNCQSTAAAAAAAAVHNLTVVTVSHFLPHTSLPHHTVKELSKAMGCCELQEQLAQVGGQVHVYGHSHINTDVVLPASPDVGAAAAAEEADRKCSHARDRQNILRNADTALHAADSFRANSVPSHGQWPSDDLASDSFLASSF